MSERSKTRHRIWGVASSVLSSRGTVTALVLLDALLHFHMWECHWLSWPPGQSLLISGPSLLGSFPTTLTPACSSWWSCFDPSTGPSTWLSWTSYHWSSPSRSLCRAFPTFSSTLQLDVACEFSDGAPYPFIQIIDKNIEQDWTQIWALGNAICDQPPTGTMTIVILYKTWKTILFSLKGN